MSLAHLVTTRRLTRRTALGAGLTLAVARGLAFAPGITAQGQALGDDAVSAIAPAATGSATSFTTPLDAAPSPDGSTIYFVAKGSTGPSVFSVPATGGQVTLLASGLPFAGLRGLAVASDGKYLYVADPLAEGAISHTGRIFFLPVGGGTPDALRGSAGTTPQALEVVTMGALDRLVFSGLDPSDGQPAVLALPASGADAPTVLAKGAPLVEPDGIAMTSRGVVYLVDRAANGQDRAVVFEIANGVVTKIADGIRPGTPAGVTLTLDEGMLAVSALDPATGTSAVVLIDLATGQKGLLTKIIGVNTSSGGLHRARNAKIAAWCGVTAGTGGTVYRIEFK